MRALIVAAGIIASAYPLRRRGPTSTGRRSGLPPWGEIVVCFYDTVSIIYAGLHTRVCMEKCIRQTDVEDTSDKGVLGKKIVDNAAGKIIYKKLVGGIDSQQSLTVIVGYEAAANIGAIPNALAVLVAENISNG